MDYIKMRERVLRRLRANGARATFRRTAEGGYVKTQQFWCLRIERRIGDLHRFDEQVELGDYKFMCEGITDVCEGDVMEYADETRVVTRFEQFKPSDTTVFVYVWTRLS